MAQLSTLTDRIRMKYLTIILGWLLNSGLFYLGWILTFKWVLEGNYWAGPILNIAIMGLHLARVPNRLFETVFILTLPWMGSLIDSLWIVSGVMFYEGENASLYWIAPFWVITLWGLLATAINHSLAWAGKNIWVAIGTGALGGTLSYWAAIKVGVVTLLVPHWEGIVCLAIAWGIAMPLCYLYSKFLKSLMQN